MINTISYFNVFIITTFLLFVIFVLRKNQDVKKEIKEENIINNTLPVCNNLENIEKGMNIRQRVFSIPRIQNYKRDPFYIKILTNITLKQGAKSPKTEEIISFIQSV